MESNPINSMLHATEDSICPSPRKRQLIVSDKDGEQCDGDSGDRQLQEVDGGDDEHGSEHFSVPSKPRRQRTLSIGTYVAQCAICEKWRTIPTKEKYEEVRAHIETDPFKCEKAREWKSDVTCNDPSDISQDGTRLWAMDQHGIPQPPPGFERLLAIRGEGCTKFADVYYTTPTGRKLRSGKEVQSYLKENPHYASQGVNLSQFSFKIPAPAQQDYVRKRANTNESDGSRKKLRKPLLEEASPTHKKPGEDNQIVPYNEGSPGLAQPEPLETELGNPPPPAV